MCFSVCISVYKNDRFDFLQIALDSLLNQIVRPTEIVLVVDGEVKSDVMCLIQKYMRETNIVRPIYLKHNVGLGNAMKIAVNTASCQ
jgi:glycosyltransferase involved in cell wall biosynthesis